MSTWHQDQNPQPLWHATKWTVVCDGVGKLTTVARWDTKEQADADAARTGGYVLAPHKEQP